MSRHVDLRDLLESWPYDPQNSVRVEGGADGREILQVRLPVGIEQYEMNGRPDGKRPYGKESALDHQLGRLAAVEDQGDGSGSFELSSDDCAELFQEGMLYYYRYVHLFQIKDWKRTARDTARNLELFDFVHAHAGRKEDQEYLERWRPYILRMNAIAQAMIEWKENLHSQAMKTTHRAINTIASLPDLEEETFQFERQRSLAALRELASKIERSRPISKLEQLERELNQAINSQEFERAAVLRDQIRDLRQSEN